MKCTEPQLWDRHGNCASSGASRDRISDLKQAGENAWLIGHIEHAEDGAEQVVIG